MFMTVTSQYSSKIVLIGMEFYFPFILGSVYLSAQCKAINQQQNHCFLTHTLQVISSP